MNVFQAKEKAYEEYAKTVTPGLVSGNSKYIVVDDETGSTVIVSDEITARDCECRWIFKGYVLNREINVNLIEK